MNTSFWNIKATRYDFYHRSQRTLFGKFSQEGHDKRNDTIETDSAESESLEITATVEQRVIASLVPVLEFQPH